MYNEADVFDTIVGSLPPLTIFITVSNDELTLLYKGVPTEAVTDADTGSKLLTFITSLLFDLNTNEPVPSANILNKSL